MKTFPCFSTFLLLVAFSYNPALAESPCGFSFSSDAASPSSAPAETRRESPITSLGHLMEARLAIMNDVAKYKWNTHGSIEDPAREQVILDGLKPKAEALGLPPQWVQHFFREQIEAGKLIQYQLFATWTKEGAGVFPNVPDLATQIRPRIDTLTTQLLHSLADNWTVIHAGTVQDEGRRQLNSNSCANGLAWLPLFDGSAVSQGWTKP